MEKQFITLLPIQKLHITTIFFRDITGLQYDVVVGETNLGFGNDGGTEVVMEVEQDFWHPTTDIALIKLRQVLVTCNIYDM